MQIDWIGCAADNFRPGRPGGFRPDAIVLHSVADLAQAELGYRNGGSFVSTHYAIAGDGRVGSTSTKKTRHFTPDSWSTPARLWSNSGRTATRITTR
ncbi:hypothetical protein MKLM6_1314 [Methylomonas koyamae]|nr:hypothetical protein MKLM6_1314 [Methylomonas koyamae]